MLTATHVVDIEGETVLEIDIVSDDGQTTRPYAVNRLLTHLDGALLTPRGSNRATPSLRVASSYEMGEAVVLLGYPENLIADNVLVASAGIVGAQVRWGDRATGMDFIMLDAVTDSGGSGGPVLNSRGEVVGILQLGGEFLFASDISGRDIE